MFHLVRGIGIIGAFIHSRTSSQLVSSDFFLPGSSFQRLGRAVPLGLYENAIAPAGGSMTTTIIFPDLSLGTEWELQAVEFYAMEANTYTVEVRGSYSSNKIILNILSKLPFAEES